jgi:hypothetical protein
VGGKEVTTPLKAMIEQLLRPWWWSPYPPWAYRTVDIDRGWYTVDPPGIFNLMWATSGIGSTQTDVTFYADKVWWAVMEGAKIKVSGHSLADHASTLTLVEFDKLLRHNRLALARQPFESNMTATKLIELVGARRRTCA